MATKKNQIKTIIMLEPSNTPRIPKYNSIHKTMNRVNSNYENIAEAIRGYSAAFLREMNRLKGN